MHRDRKERSGEQCLHTNRASWHEIIELQPMRIIVPMMIKITRVHPDILIRLTMCSTIEFTCEVVRGC